MNDSLVVLITCQDLRTRGGVQLYTRDLAAALRSLGHRPVVYSRIVGEVAVELRSRGVGVVENLDQLAEPPDVIHAQHHLPAMAALLRFPTVPALFVCHGWLPWQEAPARFPSILRYVAIDALRRDRLVLEHTIPATKVRILGNFVDTERFLPRAALPPRPRRALLFSNQASPGSALATEVERACRVAGVSLDVVGIGTGNYTARPEELLPAYDLVFARGRAAMEAMAAGVAVILADVEGAGPLVDSSLFDELRARNFGIAALQQPLTEAHLRHQIERYDPGEAARVRDRVRAECGRGAIVDQLVGLYREIVAERDSLASQQPECLAAASDYLQWLVPFIDREISTVAADLRMSRGQLALLERSPVMRLRRSILKVPLLAALYRRLRR